MKINLKELAKYENIAIVIHTRPDGDAVGSGIGLYYGLTYFGASPLLLCDMDIPKKLSILSGVEKFKKTCDEQLDLVIFSDCGDISRAGDLDINMRKAKTICIDHHISNRKVCDVNHIVPTSASTCQLVLKILEENNVPITKEIANCLYTGLMTDSGNFSHTNVNSDVFECAGRLCGYGAQPNRLNRAIFKLLEGNKYKLMGQVLSNIKLFDDGRIAYFYITKKMLEDFELKTSATEGVIDNALSIEGVQIAIAVLEGEKNAFKVSLRSIDGVNVARMAEDFGGGGHNQASGCTLCGFYEDVKDKLIRQAGFYTV